ELSDGARERLADLTRYGRSGGEGFVDPADGEQPDPDAVLGAARVRRLALAALDAAGAADTDTIETALYDRDVEVRRLAAVAAGGVDDPDQQRLLLQIALADTDGKVRYEGLRWYGRRVRLSDGCAPIVGALEDDDPHVALQAIDLLADGCRGVDVTDPGGGDPAVPDLLLALAVALPGRASNNEVGGPDFDGVNPPIGAAASAAAPLVAWHAAAHALIALAGTDPDAAVQLISAHRLHPTWQLRMYAARAAATVGAVDALEQLAQDPFPNVAAAALRGLDANLGDAADGAAVAALRSDDYQLLITAADMLEATGHPAALAVLIAALERVTLEKKETSRDPRRAILERIGELGDADRVEEIVPYLEDFDPRIAAQAAEILLAWTGTSVSPSPTPLPLTPFPTIDELLELEGARARMEMRGGGIIEIELYPFEAPTNVARFARQAREGYFEGLTFHRVVANFVIQGGSPGANEYVGDGPYGRDEVGNRSHLRGTVGISTRGRDTGDAQIFINLVDNIRLDHNYTIIGTVVSGMDVVDAALEGATIERVTIEPRSGINSPPGDRDR
ncbi:MAG: peptidylprolyl isomerase, partial [Acidobacteria bacterium]|nr:peptidylprolyl isomerase [Acidobacteriota bacterium]